MSYMRVSDYLHVGVTGHACHALRMDIDELASAVKDARLERGWSVEEAARRADMSRITWKRIEDGQPVRDTSRRTVEKLLGIADERPSVLDVAAGIAEISSDDLNPELSDYTDQELLDEISGRM